MPPGPSLWAVSDLHVGHTANRELVARLHPVHEGDWLLVAGDVAETAAAVEDTLAVLAGRFAKVVWAPGNHELWTTPADPCRSRGVERYLDLVRACREIGVATPEDAYPVWHGDGERLTIAPLLTLFDYSFRAAGYATADESRLAALAAGVLCMDELNLHPDPYISREQWCAARVAMTERRLETARADGRRMVLVSHWPLVAAPTAILHRQEIAQWCGTTLTAQWHLRFGAAAVVYGHLHVPRTTWHDGVPFHEVSLGYPREWRSRDPRPALLHPVTTARAAAPG